MDMFPRYLAAMLGIYLVEPLLTYLYVRTLWGIGEEVVSDLRREYSSSSLVMHKYVCCPIYIHKTTYHNHLSFW